MFVNKQLNLIYQRSLKETIWFLVLCLYCLVVVLEETDEILIDEIFIDVSIGKLEIAVELENFFVDPEIKI